MDNFNSISSTLFAYETPSPLYRQICESVICQIVSQHLFRDYELHKKKISKIFREKGPYAMTTDSSKLQELKQRKQSDLERVRNQRLKSIEKNNSLMFERLIGSQELYRGTSVANATIAYIKESTSGRTPRLDKPYVHQVLKNAEVENSRIFHRLAKL